MKPLFATLSLALLSALSLSADCLIDYEASTAFGASTGDFAPFYVSALSHGRLSSAHNAVAEVKASRSLDLSDRFSYAFGVDLMAGYASSNSYARFDASQSQWFTHSLHPSRFHVQQLFGQVKYRGVFLTLGLQEHESALLNQRLTSGDLIESGNSRPIPGGRVGFIDFQNIPFTNGWVQIQGEIGYGKMTDGDWWMDQYNRYNYHVNTGEWYNYKRCYFRTRPSERFSVTLGMQAAATFGGTRYIYHKGILDRTSDFKLSLSSFWNTFLPVQGSGEDFYEGNHLGSWDFLARYTLTSGDCLKAYFQWPWEDGSGIGRRNGWDGLWGVEWKSARESAPLTGVVLEYIDMTNQSGPQHFAPADLPGNTIGAEATGADDYYNNQYYNAYAHYGLSIGSPMLMAPLYNLDGYPAYVANRMRGFHAAAEGAVMPSLKWRARFAYRVGYGNGRVMLPENIRLTSVALDVDWLIPSVKGLALAACIAYDNGSMPGSSFGVLAKLSYSGFLNLKK